MKRTLLAGITKNNELYFLEIDTTNDKRNGYNEFSMSGFTVSPISKNEAKKQVLEHLKDGEEWKFAVQNGKTKLGLNDWIKYVIKTDGVLAGFDNSLFENEIVVDGEIYIFESGACGQHEERELKHYFIDKELFVLLMQIWDRYHLKELPENSAKSIVEEAMRIRQDQNMLVEKAVRMIQIWTK